MYIWIGIDVDSQLTEIKEKAIAAERRIGFCNSNFTLPLHISLKISFPIADELFIEVKDDIVAILNEYEAFEIDVCGIELFENICWIRMHRNLDLDDIHDKLNKILLEKYGVPLHEYDTDYKFHTTLFMDKDPSKVLDAFNALHGVEAPSKLIAERFVIGTSESGALGTYRVVFEYRKSGR